MTRIPHSHVSRHRASRRFQSASVKTLLFWFFVVSVLVCVIGFCLFASILVRQQLRRNVFNSVRNGLSQTTELIHYRLYEVLEDFIRLEQSRAVHDLLFSTLEDDVLDSSDRNIFLLSMHGQLQDVFHRNYSVLESAVVALQYHDEPPIVLHQSEYPVVMSQFSFENEVDGRALIDQAGEYHWRNKHVNTILPNRYSSNEVASVYKVIGDRSSTIRMFILFNFREEFFRTLFGNAQASPSSYYTLVGNGVAMDFAPLGAAQVLSPSIISRIQDSAGEGERIISFRGEDGQLYHVLWEYLSMGHWNIALVIPELDIISSFRRIASIIWLSAVVTIALAFLFVAYTHRSISAPIGRWMHRIHDITTDEGSHILLEDALCLEMVQVNQGILHLLGKVEKLNQEKIDGLNRQKELEFRMLQEQIKPHFLYNVLTNIEHLGRRGEFEKASRLTKALNSFYRISLSRGQAVILLKDEVEQVMSYLTIQEISHKDMKYTVALDPETASCAVLKLCLQPLVENALRHAPVYGEELAIHIASHKAHHRDGDSLILTVRDNGTGIAEDRLHTMQKALDTQDWSAFPRSFGIRNVHERIRLRYGKAYGLDISCPSEGGTVCTLVLPYLTDLSPEGGEYMDGGLTPGPGSRERENPLMKGTSV